MTNLMQEQMSQKSSDMLRELTEKAKLYVKKFEVNCALIGMSGASKSSLINTILGRKIAKAGSTEQTMEAQKIFTDIWVIS